MSERQPRLLNAAIVASLLAGSACAQAKPTQSPETYALPLAQTYNPTETPPPTQIVETRVPYQMFGVDFADTRHKVEIKISLGNGQVFNINSNTIAFENTDPSEAPYAYQFRDPANGTDNMIFYIHSGVRPLGLGREPAESARIYLESQNTGSLGERLPVAQTNARMQEFLDAGVSISQGDRISEGLRVLGILRISPENLGAFAEANNQTSEDVMNTLIAVDPTIAQFATDGKPQIILIFCGWHNVEEDTRNPYKVGFYAWSRYAIIIGE